MRQRSEILRRDCIVQRNHRLRRMQQIPLEPLQIAATAHQMQALLRAQILDRLHLPRQAARHNLDPG